MALHHVVEACVRRQSSLRQMKPEFTRDPASGSILSLPLMKMCKTGRFGELKVQLCRHLKGMAEEVQVATPLAQITHLETAAETTRVTHMQDSKHLLAITP